MLPNTLEAIFEHTVVSVDNENYEYALLTTNLLVLWCSVELGLLPCGREPDSPTAAIASTMVALTVKKTAVRRVIPQPTHRKPTIRSQHSYDITNRIYGK